MEAHQGVALPQPHGRPGEHMHPLGLAGPDVYVPRHRLPGGGQLPGGLVRQGQDLLRPPAQQHPMLRQGDPPAPEEQGPANLRFQVHELPGQGGLGQVQGLGGGGDALLPGHR